MSTLLVDELFSGVVFDQTIKINRMTNIVHIRPWVYLHGTLVDGDFQVEIIHANGTVATQSINFAAINAIKTETYAHGYIRFDFDSLALAVGEGNTEEDYTLRFTMQNHNTDTNNFLAMVRNWEAVIYPLSDTALNDSTKPVGLQLYEIRSR